jgi:hypothetical protein
MGEPEMSFALVLVIVSSFGAVDVQRQRDIEKSKRATNSYLEQRKRKKAQQIQQLIRPIQFKNSNLSL